jgi:hypothetical protein
MTGQEIINKFELYVDDLSELSSTEELELANKIYFNILDDRPWEFLKKEWSTTTTGAAYLTLPTDFRYFIENQGYTDNSIQDESGSRPMAVFVNGSPYKIINWSDRRQYVNSAGYCYVDIVAGRLYFTATPTSGLTVSADYIYKPAALTLSTEPVFPETYQHAIYHGMAVDDMIVQLFDKARSYASENQAKFNEYMRSLGYYNSNLQNF